MAKRRKPPRPWDMDDLLDLGDKQGEEGTYLKAVPVLILEKWVRDGKVEGEANYVRTNELKRRLESSGLRRRFKPKGDGGIFGSLTSKQKARNLTRPILIEPQGEGMFQVNLPHYEPLLQEYREMYRNDRSKDYKKLFPDKEPDWGTPPPKGRAEYGEVTPTLSPTEYQDEIKNLFAPIEQTLRDQQRTIDRFTVENQKLQAKLASLETAAQRERETPYHRIVDEELRTDCEKYLDNHETFIDAIRRASTVLEMRLKGAAEGAEAESLRGVALVRYLLAKDTGKLIIRDDPNEQDGVHQLFSGAFALIRNPPAHKKVQYTELEAWQAINLIDFLLSLLQQARPRGTR